MPEITTIRLPYTDYYLTIGRARYSKWQNSGKTVLANYTTSNLALKSGKVSKHVIYMIQYGVVFSVKFNRIT